jgi:hypothetical protein
MKCHQADHDTYYNPILDPPILFYKNTYFLLKEIRKNQKFKIQKYFQDIRRSVLSWNIPKEQLDWDILTR